MGGNGVTSSVEDLMGDSGLRRASRLAALREFRPRRIPARLTVAFILAVAGVLAALTALTWPDSFLYEKLTQADTTLRSLRRDDPGVLATAALMAASGAALVLIAALPGRRRIEPLRSPDPQVVAGISRLALRRVLAATATEVPGIENASVRLRGRLRSRAVVRAETIYHTPGNLAELVRDAVADRLAEIDPVYRRRVLVRLTTKQRNQAR
jgi:hypothetical protein